MTKHIVIIGGGASGIVMAAHLAQNCDQAVKFRITIVEAGPHLGRGLAYSTSNPSHLLNVRAAGISAFAEVPDDFVRWLHANHPEAAAEAAMADGFVPRMFYGDYLEDLLRTLSTSAQTAPVRIIAQECCGLRQHEAGAEVLLADGSVVPAHFVVIASGYGVRSAADGPLRDPWQEEVPQDRDARVVVLGTGLTMVDKVLSLLDADHQGPILAISRKGLLPRPHGPHHPLSLSTADIPLGASIHYLMRWLTRLVVAHQAVGGDWRDVMDGLRPHIQTIWKHLPKDSRARFLRHAASFWDIHRHRMPQTQATRLQAALYDGKLAIKKGRFVDALTHGDRTILTYHDIASNTCCDLEADAVYDCRGIRRKSIHGLPPLLNSLLKQGQARQDCLGLGLEFDSNFNLIDARGKSSHRIFGIGPVTLGTFWETIAIPDIRLQAQHIARQLQAHRLEAFTLSKSGEVH
ncbi:putative NAD(P)/FAD-binding protein YdhS [Agrobacterium vitis]|nr:putative NAD(P)/FAD-binding protein YdhS [Agrobacterium vitis]